jgi:eukaryotic-like serine/threonine-protein kinase
MPMTQLQNLAAALENRYRVVREVGRGGMATVYIAEDLKHRRDVAIKVFHPELAAAIGNDRFLREIELTAGLTHPHILPLYDSGMAADLLYYVMPYIQGETLREHLSRKQRLAVDEALRIAGGVSAALAFAHRKGIVHRDIKPENILLQNGHAFVADFGIARPPTMSTGSGLTQTGVVIGTPTYMSPEQTLGEAVDGRTDIYSLACVFFEMLAGAPPFSGPSISSITSRRLTESAPRLRSVLPEIPAAIDDAVAKALARQAKDRFATAEEFAAAMAKTPAPAASAAKGIVVLPFGNLSPDPENEFFADGLTDEVIADLSGIRALRVISRTSAMRFKGTNKDLRSIARELDVRYVLEGNVRRAGQSLRVTAQLIDAEADSHLWSEKYSGNVADVFAIQEEISRKIAGALEVRLSDTESRAIAARPIDDPAAYDCYVRARHEVYRFTREGLDRAKELAETGLSLIGENALLLATRGMVSWYYLNFSLDLDERHLEEAASYAARALKLDPENYFAIFLRGLVEAKRGNVESALVDLRKAYDLKPGDAMVAAELNRYVMTAGQELSETSRTIFADSVKFDPLAALNWAQGAWRYFNMGQFDECARAAQRILELTSVGNPARVYAGYYFTILDRRDEAIVILDAEAAALGDMPYGLVALFLARGLRQDPEAPQAVKPQLEKAAFWTEYLALFLADGYSLIGQNGKAVEWIRVAVNRGFINYSYLTKLDPLLEGVKKDPEFATLMEQVHRRWQAVRI